MFLFKYAISLVSLQTETFVQLKVAYLQYFKNEGIAKTNRY